MITPLDIQTKTFSNSPMGYKKAEVDAFFEELLRDYEHLYKTSNESAGKIKELNKLVDSYKAMEETMKNTLVVAQSSAEQLTAAAKKEAESIVAEATQKSNEIIARANERLSALSGEYEALKKEISMFVMRSKSEFEVQIKALEQAGERLEKTSI